MATTQSNNINIACWNCRGFSSSVPFLRSLLDNNDVVLISEHWLHNNRLQQLDGVDDKFNQVSRASNRSSEESFGLHRGQGGVAIFWKKDLKGVSVMETIKHDRVCGIRVECANNSVVVILAVYMPAVGSRDNLSVTLDELGAFIENLEEGAVPIICGDFNGDMGAEGGPRGYGKPTRAGREVLKFMRDQNLIAANLMTTATGPVDTYIGHNGSSVIDYVFIPQPLGDKIRSCRTGRNEGSNTSDHVPIEVSLDIASLPRSVYLDKPQKRIRWDKCSPEFIHRSYQTPVYNKLFEVRARLNDQDLANPDIDACVNIIINTLHETAEVVPKSKYAKHLKPYWCEELNELKRVKMGWFNQWKEEGRSKDPTDLVRINMLKSKKVFNKCLRRLSKQYDDGMIAEAASKAEINHDDFWRILKQARGSSKVKVNTIRNQWGKVVYEPGEILEVWHTHFNKISTPKQSPDFDYDHFQYVTRCVSEYLRTEDLSDFLINPITECETRGAVKKLNNGKAPGYDGLTTEHIKFAGEPLVHILCLLFNQCIRNEYVPLSLRKGIQVPLYKGKNTCTLECDNYRGITLLSTLNKLLEIIIWDRISSWWYRNHVVSDLQGAGRRGFSCVHTALTLQETISKEREGNKKVFVAYYDVSKAFDSVWIDGLFYQLYEMGITGSLWRLLYRMYINFQCCVRIGNETSEWYDMGCGIHQGGYLSLVKYTAFINSLITELEQSTLCSTIYHIKVSPVGYADDLATCTTSKNKTDRIMSIVHKHGCKWRYSFNASKSAVLVFGETSNERKHGSVSRMFRLGTERVKERIYYDHVGVKTCVKGDTHVRTDEKVSKARKVLNMSTAIGIRKGGINLSTCNVIYWSVVVPTLCFGCEVWYIKQKDVDSLCTFQRYAARRIQRLHPRSLNITSSFCLGWMNILNYIKARKLLFIRTILCMEEYMPIRKILIERMSEYNPLYVNEFESPIVQILGYGTEMDLIDNIRHMCNGNLMSKEAWKKLVWQKVWDRDNIEWNEVGVENPNLDLVRLVCPTPAYIIWWSISDKERNYMRQCETMVRLICHASLLKADDCRLKRATFGARMCILCHDAAYENTRHMVTQCHYHHETRTRMLDSINEIARIDCQKVFGVLMGAYIEGFSYEEMVPIWKIACSAIYHMYREVLRFHERYN